MSELAEVKTEEIMEIADDQMAEDCLELIRNRQEEKAKWKEFYADRLKAVNDTCDMEIARLTMALMAYFKTVPHRVTKKQESYALPSGKLVYKQQDIEYVRDDEAVIDWLKANNGAKFIKTKESLDWQGLKETLSVVGDTVADENGAVIPCITAVERENVFKVELKREN